MRYFSILLGLVLLLSLSAGAQSTTSNSVLLPASYFAVPATPDFAANAPSISLTPFSAAPANTPPSGFAPSTPLSLSLMPAPAAPPQDVTSVFENYAWQLYGGYTFLRFYELPGVTPNMNGFNYSVVYYWKDWFGVDGEFAATHATQDNVSSWFLFGGGGRASVGPREKVSNSGRTPWSVIRTSRRRRPPAVSTPSPTNWAVEWTCPSNRAGPCV